MKMRGETIIEVVIALGVGVIIISAMTLVVISALGNTRQSSSSSTATQYAQEGMEIVRRMKDSEPATFINLANTYCLASSCSAVTTTAGSCGPKTTTCGTNIGTIFVREVDIQQNYLSCKPPVPVTGVTYTFVTSTVSWTDSKCANNTYCHKTKLQSCLSNYQKVSAP